MEWNIYADPKAADIVFSSGIPVTLVSLDATNQVPMTREFYELLSQALQPQLKLIYSFMKEIVDHFGIEGFLRIFYLWDPLAAMICVDPSIAITQSLPIRMDLKTAHTECVENGTLGSAMINVATHIPNAHLILERFFNEIKLNLLRKQIPPASPMSLYGLPIKAAEAEVDIIKEPTYAVPGIKK